MSSGDSAKNVGRGIPDTFVDDQFRQPSAVGLEFGLGHDGLGVTMELLLCRKLDNAVCSIGSYGQQSLTNRGLYLPTI